MKTNGLKVLVLATVPLLAATGCSTSGGNRSLSGSDVVGAFNTVTDLLDVFNVLQQSARMLENAYRMYQQ